MSIGNRAPSSLSKISSGISGLDGLIDYLHIGDNVVWEVDAGTSFDVFIQNFLRQSFSDAQKIIYISFNRSPQSILNEIGKSLHPEHFKLIDCFTSGKGKNDNTFLRFYENPSDISVVRIKNPKNIEEFTLLLNSIEDEYPPGARYIFDSITGMQDLWGDEDATFRFFTYMCPRLFDLDTVAYWILEKDAHSQKFKANLRHITQVVIDIYKRRDSLYIKALKLIGRQERNAFRPHLYEIGNGGTVTITLPRKEAATDIGSRLKELRTMLGMSQKDLAEKVDLTSSFISQLESNQISPSLSSFIQICNALDINPGDLLSKKDTGSRKWLIKNESVSSNTQILEDGIKIYTITTGERLSARRVIFPPGTILKKHFQYKRVPEFIYVVKGDLSVSVEGSMERLTPGDYLYFNESFPSQWKNEGGDDAELIAVW